MLRDYWDEISPFLQEKDEGKKSTHMSYLDIQSETAPAIILQPENEARPLVMLNNKSSQLCQDFLFLKLKNI